MKAGGSGFPPLPPLLELGGSGAGERAFLIDEGRWSGLSSAFLRFLHRWVDQAFLPFLRFLSWEVVGRASRSIESQLTRVRKIMVFGVHIPASDSCQPVPARKFQTDFTIWPPSFWVDCFPTLFGNCPLASPFAKSWIPFKAEFPSKLNSLPPSSFTMESYC